ncbi:MAG TPA: uroporphyrinogen decarboxylase [Candidatus Saccharimonadales bacterium]|nr:uroporphyrinogen decarboxylase [Candidatus Saccharimonadales bacterium]
MTVTRNGSMTGAELMLATARREPADRTPIWFMRQAGRCLAGYRTLRETYDILTITRTPELCAQVTLMPVTEFGVDAAVMYADIMLPLTGMGVPFSIDPGIGPIIHAPVRSADDIKALRIVDPHESTPELYEAIRLVRKQLDGTTAVVGFAGGPFTVASYMIEGKPTKEFSKTKAMLHGEPELWHRLMSTLTEVTIAYLRAQVEAGAQMIQLFDSWAGALSVAAYETSVLPYSRRILEAVAETGVPTIHFGTTTSHLLESMASAGSDVISVDWRLPLDVAWSRIGDRAIQGNLDPGVMLAPFDVIAREARLILSQAAGRPGHIFNLGHGVLPETSSDDLKRLAELVHEETAGA